MKNMKKLDHLVLAEGEITGHAHRAAAGVLYEDGDGFVLDTEGKPVSVTHEEHAVVLTPTTQTGRVLVRRVREMDHAAESARQVAD